jgi:DNA-binding response OmpR family regulator
MHRISEDGAIMTGQANILVIEDDEIVARTVERCLRTGDYRVRVAGTGVEGLQLARREIPDLVVLDVIMPGMDGYTVCREMRNDTLLRGVPILFLTARSKDDDRITGFVAGADDYLGKPFNVDELLLRIKAILRRARPAIPSSVAVLAEGLRPASQVVQTERLIIAVNGFELNTRTYEFKGPNGVTRLTPVQYDLLYHLMSHPGEIFSPARLLDEVWDYPSDAGSPDLVRVHIKNLRERIEKDPRNPEVIRTISGYGYTIQKVDEDTETAHVE